MPKHRERIRPTPAAKDSIAHIMQTRFGAGDIPNRVAPGNCFQATVASILGLQLEDVPDEADTMNRLLDEGKNPQIHRDTWGPYWLDLQQWLGGEHGWQLADIENKVLEGVVDDMVYIANGPSPRGLTHSTVYYGANMIHDPHPDGGGIRRVDHLTLLIPVAPARMTIK